MPGGGGRGVLLELNDTLECAILLYFKSEEICEQIKAILKYCIICISAFVFPKLTDVAMAILRMFYALLGFVNVHLYEYDNNIQLSS